MLTILPAHTPDHLPAIHRLFREYAEGLPHGLEFQQFDRELAELPGKYAPPEGRLLIALEDGQHAGCVALRALEPGICEMKRLFLRPAHRGRGAGRTLAEAIIREAAAAGYRRMRLDTLASMTTAATLYESLGFRRIAPYYHNPFEGAVFMELELAGGRAAGG